MDWKGAQVAKNVRKASVKAIDDATEEAAQDASMSHWWANRQGQLEAAIVNEDAVETSRGARGRFGATKRGFYGLFLERRTPFLRPALDRVARTLARKIATRLR